MKFFLLVLLIGTSIPHSAAAEEPNDKQRSGVRITLQVFAGKKSTLQRLGRELMAPATQAKAFAQLDQFVTDGTVELTSEVIGQTSADTEFTAFQGEAVQYPIQFDSPELLTAPSDPKQSPAALGTGPPAFAYAANTYESRNVGTSLTLTATTNQDGERIVVSADWKRGWLVQWDEFEVGRLPNNEKMIIKQPRFAEAGSKGTFEVSSGERTVLGVHPVPGVPDRVEVVLMVLETKAAKPK